MILRGDELSVQFQGVKAVNGVSIDLHEGEILGLIGPNGAGKTTLMNALSGFASLTGGKIWFGDQDVSKWSPNRLAKLGIARTFQNVRLFRGMTVEENVEVAAVGVGRPSREAKKRAGEVLKWVGLSSRAHLLTEQLSFGEEQRVGIARAIATSPKFLLLDEPAAGLDESESDQLLALISQIRNSEGCGVMIIEHDMRLIMSLCDRIHVLDVGETIADGSPEDVQKDARVRAAYLGTKNISDTMRYARTLGSDRSAPVPVESGRPRELPGESASAPCDRALLNVDEVHVAYGRVPALRGLSLKVRPGEMVGVVGPNGAGKSTLLMTVAGMLRPNQGQITFRDQQLTDQAPEDIVRFGVSLVPERRRIFVALTVEENLRVAATSRTQRHEIEQDLAELYERFPILYERRNSAGGSLSGGQQQQLAIARALLTRPTLLLVDEPSLGLAPIIVERVFESLIALRNEGVSVLLVEQNALATIEMSDRVYLLRRGRIEMESEASDAEVRSNMLSSYIDQLGFQA